MVNIGANEKNKRRGIYLLPNLFTTGGLFAGFYAIVSAMSGHFEAAAIAIFVAFLMDGMDGRVARMTNTESAFGAEYDSLADMVAFGVAPALVMYSWTLIYLKKVGWVAAFAFTAAAALRLARFNTQVGIQDKRFFQGLPSPGAAAVLAGFVWLGHDLGLQGEQISVIAATITAVMAALMVSNIRYRSFKQFDFKDRVPFVTMLAVVLLFVLIAIEPPTVLFAGFFLFSLSGPILTLWDIKRVRSQRQLAKRGEKDVNQDKEDA